MNHLIVGLGNPGEEYVASRHNAGRMVLDVFRKTHDFSQWENDKKAKGLVSKGDLHGKKLLLLLPETFMNNSGESVRTFAKTLKDAEKVIVVYDDFDLPMGTYKISWNRSSGGHNGVQSIIDHLKTELFIRVRIGVSPVLSSGKIKKPHGEEAVNKFILGNFTKGEQETLKKLSKEIVQSIESIVFDGYLVAMAKFN